MSTTDIVYELIEDYNHDPRQLLESLVRALPYAVLVDHLEYISDVEDWTWRVNGKGEIYQFKDPDHD